MDATTMRSTSSLLHKLKTDYPNIFFIASDTFSWDPDLKTVFYANEGPQFKALLLHEVSHGLLEHRAYKRDIELLAMEAAAWNKAKELATQYHFPVSDTVAEEHLDTYRDWLHARSTCTHCSATGYQSSKDMYTCPACTTEWRVNEARICELRRYTVQKT
jgi:Zn finger protein HypA/HybF involved in hydrogenase expression